MDERKISQSEKVDLQNRSINQDNFIIRRSQGLNLREKRVLATAIAKIDSVRTLPRKAYESGYDVSFTVQEFRECYPGLKNAWKDLKEAVRGLMRSVITEDLGNGKRRLYQWVMRAEYGKGWEDESFEGQVRLTIHPDVLPKLTYLREQFTSYKLRDVSDLKSLYSWRLWELLQQFKSTGMLHITLDDFHEAMETPPSLKKNFSLVRQRVLKPSTKELQKKNDVTIDYEVKKKGRKVHSLTFRFEENKQIGLDI